jgi:hypothetical protein
MRFSTFTVLALATTGADAFGVSSKPAFSGAAASRGTLTVLEGVKNPPPNESTPVKALGFLGAAAVSMGILLGGPTISSPNSPGNIQLFGAPTVETTKVVAPKAEKKATPKAEKKAAPKAEKKAAPKAEKKVCPKKTNKGPYDLDIDECVAEDKAIAAEKAADAKAAAEAKAAAKAEAKLAAEAAKQKVRSCLRINKQK